MTVEQILKLAELGYTKADIEALDSPAKMPVEEPEKPAEEVEQAPAEKPVTAGFDVMAEMMRGYLDSMQATLKEIQRANVKASAMPEQSESIDTALAAIITPTKRK